MKDQVCCSYMMLDENVARKDNPTKADKRELRMHLGRGAGGVRMKGGKSVAGADAVVR